MVEEARECAKCGAILPSGDEGLCEVCGTAFGYRTSVMPIVTPAAIAQVRGGVVSSDATPPPMLPAPRRQAPPPRALILALGAAVLVLAAVLVALLAT